MKTAIVTTVLISSITFFSGCSSKELTPDRKIKKEAKALNAEKIIGINRGDNSTNMFVVQDDTTPKYHFIMNRVHKTNNISIEDLPDATVVPITPKPVVYSYNNYNNNFNNTIYDDNHNNDNNYVNDYTPNVSGDIEIVSYGNPEPANHTKIYNNSKNIIKELEYNAKSFLGTKYVWGATGPNKFDCSGFTQWVFRDLGINIPRVSRNQAKVGQYVSYENLRKGDMVFFDTRKKKSGVVTHVGIYLGNGNFIHASSKAKKVVIFNFNDKPYYKKRFLWGRRVINTNTHYASNY